MASNRAYMTPLDRYFVNKTPQPLNPQKEIKKCILFYCSVLSEEASPPSLVMFFFYFPLNVFRRVVDSSISACLPVVPMQHLHYTQ